MGDDELSSNHLIPSVGSPVNLAVFVAISILLSLLTLIQKIILVHLYIT